MYIKGEGLILVAVWKQLANISIPILVLETYLHKPNANIPLETFENTIELNNMGRKHPKNMRI